MCIFAWLKTMTTRAAVLLLVTLCAHGVLAQTAPASSNHPWLGPWEQQIKRDAGMVRDSVSTIDASKTYSLAELIDFAQANNPETRFAWERARAQAAALGVARRFHARARRAPQRATYSDSARMAAVIP